MHPSTLFLALSLSFLGSFACAERRPTLYDRIILSQPIEQQLPRPEHNTRNDARPTETPQRNNLRPFSLSPRNLPPQASIRSLLHAFALRERMKEEFEAFFGFEPDHLGQACENPELAHRNLYTRWGIGGIPEKDTKEILRQGCEILMDSHKRLDPQSYLRFQLLLLVHHAWLSSKNSYVSLIDEISTPRFSRTGYQDEFKALMFGFSHFLSHDLRVHFPFLVLPGNAYKSVLTSTTFATQDILLDLFKWSVRDLVLSETMHQEVWDTMGLAFAEREKLRWRELLDRCGDDPKPFIRFEASHNHPRVAPVILYLAHWIKSIDRAFRLISYLKDLRGQVLYQPSPPRESDPYEAIQSVFWVEREPRNLARWVFYSINQAYESFKKEVRSKATVLQAHPMVWKEAWKELYSRLERQFQESIGPLLRMLRMFTHQLPISSEEKGGDSRSSGDRFSKWREIELGTGVSQSILDSLTYDMRACLYPASPRTPQSPTVFQKSYSPPGPHRLADHIIVSGTLTSLGERTRVVPSFSESPWLEQIGQGSQTFTSANAPMKAAFVVKAWGLRVLVNQGMQTASLAKVSWAVETIYELALLRDQLSFYSGITFLRESQRYFDYFMHRIAKEGIKALTEANRQGYLRRMGDHLVKETIRLL
ncbi:MAG: hypothetical protein DHS80DRAFT_21305 [Piptocephalis tieghemiana]|nr:MAG: hypothetical protein DHS80DRAFT_21305 [Piptocephalis tieghemiana]